MHLPPLLVAVVALGLNSTLVPIRHLHRPPNATARGTGQARSAFSDGRHSCGAPNSPARTTRGPGGLDTPIFGVRGPRLPWHET